MHSKVTVLGLSVSLAVSGGHLALEMTKVTPLLIPDDELSYYTAHHTYPYTLTSQWS